MQSTEERRIRLPHESFCSIPQPHTLQRGSGLLSRGNLSQPFPLDSLASPSEQPFFGLHHVSLSQVPNPCQIPVAFFLKPTLSSERENPNPPSSVLLFPASLARCVCLGSSEGERVGARHLPSWGLLAPCMEMPFAPSC